MAKKTPTAVKRASKPAGRPSTNAPTPTQPPATEETSMYEVLKPAVIHGKVIKPPTWIELTAAEARPYQDKQILGTEAGEVPNADDDDSGTQASGERPAGSAGSSNADGQGGS